MNTRDLLGEFLRRRREALSPTDVGLPVGRRRRTPGLRRDEVAELAKMSTVYYERLEQGRGAQPSAAVLAGMSTALQLSDDEREHLYHLAGLASPASPKPPAPASTAGRPATKQPTSAEPVGAEPTTARPSAAEPVDPNLDCVLRAVDDTTPGFISDDLGDLLAQNKLNVRLFGDLIGLPGRASNLVYRWFALPGWRDRLDPPGQQGDTSQAYVADLRREVTRRGNDPHAATLVADLCRASDEFVRLWKRHVVSALHCSGKVVHDPRVGRLDLECAIITSPHSRQRLLLMKPAAGTPTAERLARLATYN